MRKRPAAWPKWDRSGVGASARARGPQRAAVERVVEAELLRALAAGLVAVAEVPRPEIDWSQVSSATGSASTTSTRG